jgi:hypothetical protein
VIRRRWSGVHRLSLLESTILAQRVTDFRPCEPVPKQVSSLKKRRIGLWSEEENRGTAP